MGLGHSFVISHSRTPAVLLLGEAVVGGLVEVEVGGEGGGDDVVVEGEVEDPAIAWRQVSCLPGVRTEDIWPSDRSLGMVLGIDQRSIAAYHSF